MALCCDRPVERVLPDRHSQQMDGRAGGHPECPPVLSMAFRREQISNYWIQRPRYALRDPAVKCRNGCRAHRSRASFDDTIPTAQANGSRDEESYPAPTASLFLIGGNFSLPASASYLGWLDSSSACRKLGHVIAAPAAVRSGCDGLSWSGGGSTIGNVRYTVPLPLKKR